jgi:hypothetical protein
MLCPRGLAPFYRPAARSVQTAPEPPAADCPRALFLERAAAGGERRCWCWAFTFNLRHCCTRQHWQCGYANQPPLCDCPGGGSARFSVTAGPKGEVSSKKPKATEAAYYRCEIELARPLWVQFSRMPDNKAGCAGVAALQARGARKLRTVFLHTNRPTAFSLTQVLSRPRGHTSGFCVLCA